MERITGKRVLCSPADRVRRARSLTSGLMYQSGESTLTAFWILSSSSDIYSCSSWNLIAPSLRDGAAKIKPEISARWQGTELLVEASRRGQLARSQKRRVSDFSPFGHFIALYCVVERKHEPQASSDPSPRVCCLPLLCLASQRV